jgi:hypothetical protein
MMDISSAKTRNDLSKAIDHEIQVLGGDYPGVKIPSKHACPYLTPASSSPSFFLFTPHTTKMCPWCYTSHMSAVFGGILLSTTPIFGLT